jgi:hypothetical protein
MATEAYPAGASSGFAEESAIDSERDRLISALGGRMQNVIVDPYGAGHFDESHSGSSLDIDIDTTASGLAFMGGHLVENTSTITLTLDASSTNEIFLVVRDSATGNADVTYTSDGSTPSGQHLTKLWEADTDTSGVTATRDFRRYVPYRDDQPGRNITGRKAGTSGTIATDSTGVKTVQVSFPHGYRDGTDQANAWLNAVSDQSVEFGWIRVDPTTIDPSGFTIEARVSAAASSGATADFTWEAYGT